MKGSISMKSWKTTISLSALLFLVFALAVLSWPFIGVSMPSSLSSPASPANGSITYDKGANVITATGYSSRTPCTFWDLWNASYVNSWNVVNAHFNSCYAPSNHTTQTQYLFECKLVIGDGSTATYFGDNNKQIVLLNGVKTAANQNFIYVMNSATVTFGLLSDATLKRTYAGCDFLDLTVAYYGYMIRGQSTSATVYLYSCSFHSSTLEQWFEGTRIWNTMSDGKSYPRFISITTSDVNNLIVSSHGSYGYGLRQPRSTITLNNLYLITTQYAIWAETYAATVKDVYAQIGSGYLMRLSSTGTNDHYLINVNSNSWTFSYSSSTGKIYRQYTFDLQVTCQNNVAIQNANVTISNNIALVGSWLTNSTGQIPTQTLTMGYYNQTGGNAIYDYDPYNLTITKDGYQTYTGNSTLSQKTNWTIALQPLTDGGSIEHVGFVPVDPGLTSPSGTYRWLDVADQAYGIGYRNSYNYSQAPVEVAYCTEGNKLQGLLKARNLKPNFAYQLKLVGTPGTADNERIGLAGRWWQEEWTGTTWANGQNLNDKGDGSSPNPNDQTYLSRRYIQDSSSPTGYHYRYTGYLVFDYFMTDSNGTATLQFETGSCYHVMWKTTQRSNATNDGPVKTVTFDPAPSQPAYDTDYPSNTVSIFGEWERLPMGQVNLQPGEYNCQIVLTEESFHGSGGALGGNWAGAVTANIMFTIN